MDFSDDLHLLVTFAQSGADDRTLAIILVSYIEKYLGRLIAQKMPGTNSALREKIFSPDGWIGTLGAKNDIARALDIISSVELENLKLLASVRNKFAHNIEINSFDHQEISKRTNKLKFIGWSISEDSGRTIEIHVAVSKDISSERKFDQLSSKEKFEHTATFLCMGMHNTLNHAHFSLKS